MRAALLALAIALACALFAAWFFTSYERVVTEIPATYQGEARLNDFFAAEMLMRELDFDADSRASLTPSEWLPAAQETLLVRLSATFAAPDELDLLKTWVLDGGHLVLLAPRASTESTNDVLEGFGLRLIEVEFPAEPYVDKRVLTARDGAKAKSVGYTVNRAAAWQSLEVEGDSFSGATLSDEYGIVAARRQWGGGFVTVIAGSALFENPFLADADHARLLLDVVAGYVQPGAVWFVYDVAFPPLWRLIWDNFPYVVAGVVLTMLLWLWSVIPRFGSAVASHVPVRRSIVEHVKAAGLFVWRHHGARTLVASSTSAVLRSAESRHLGIGRLTLNEQASLIAKMTRQPVPAVLAALEPSSLMGQREFTHRIQALQRIRNEL